MAYRWIITEDHIPDAERSDAGTEGPGAWTPIAEDCNPAKFEMLDDDGQLYYTGMIYGEYTGFEPLDDFGTPNAGCTSIKINGKIL